MLKSELDGFGGPCEKDQLDRDERVGNCTHMIYFDEKEKKNPRKGVFLERRRLIEKGTGAQVSSRAADLFGRFSMDNVLLAERDKGPPGPGDPPTIHACGATIYREKDLTRCASGKPGRERERHVRGGTYPFTARENQISYFS